MKPITKKIVAIVGVISALGAAAVTLDAKKISDARIQESNARIQERKELADDALLKAAGIEGILSTPEFTELARALGYNGVIYDQGPHDLTYRSSKDEYVLTTGNIRVAIPAERVRDYLGE